MYSPKINDFTVPFSFPVFTDVMLKHRALTLSKIFHSNNRSTTCFTSL